MLNKTYDKYAMFLMHGNNGLSRIEATVPGAFWSSKDSYANCFAIVSDGNYAQIDVVDFRTTTGLSGSADRG